MPAKPAIWRQPGDLVAFPAGRRLLDGFWSHGPRRRSRLLVLVHGMGGDFFHSSLKKELMRRGPEGGCDVLSFNNRGSREGVRSERFSDCLADLDAALAFGRRQGYRRFVLAGHSTGCQKILHYQDRRRPRDVGALLHLAPGDDHAILRRDARPAALARLTAWCRRRVRAGRGDDPVPPALGPPPLCEGFTARRFLSIAEAGQVEADLFRYAGPLRAWARQEIPMLVLFGDREEYACLPVPRMGEVLAARTRSRRFAFEVIRGADHGFHGRERETARALYRFVRRAC